MVVPHVFFILQLIQHPPFTAAKRLFHETVRGASRLVRPLKTSKISPECRHFIHDFTDFQEVLNSYILFKSSALEKNP